MTAAAVIERLQGRDLHSVACAVCKVKRVPIAEICGRSRHPETVEVRHMVWGVFREKLGMSYSAIARVWDVDHTTVMAALKKVHKPVENAGKRRAAIVHEILAMGGEAVEPPLIEPEQAPELPCEPSAESLDPSRALASRALSDQDLLISQSSSLSGTSDSAGSCRERRAHGGPEVKVTHEPEAKPEAKAKPELSGQRPVFLVPDDEPEPATKRPKRRAPELPMPADWKPDESHYAKAKELGFARAEVDRMAEAFRAHAEMHARTAASWPGAFRTWLLKEPAIRASRPAQSRTLVQRDDDSKRLWKIPEGF